MHDKQSEKPVLGNDHHSDGYFHSVRLFRQRLTELDEVSGATLAQANPVDVGTL